LRTGTAHPVQADLINKVSKMKRTLALAATCALFGLGGCGSDGDGSAESADSRDERKAGLPRGSEPVTLDPADFTTEIDNPYFTLSPGSKWVYREDTQRVEITVTNDTRKIKGITTRVVHDEVRQDGKLVEDTHDWYAQDSAGNVWYMGEATTEYENGKPKTTEGSWEAGVDGAEPGIIMPAEPAVGQSYRQEYYKGHAEDRARVVTLNAQVKVPAGRFDDAVETEDIAPLGNRTVEHKYYADGTGLVLTIGADGVREELVRFSR
jgi:hypothetical protein